MESVAFDNVRVTYLLERSVTSSSSSPSTMSSSSELMVAAPNGVWGCSMRVCARHFGDFLDRRQRHTKKNDGCQTLFVEADPATFSLKRSTTRRTDDREEVGSEPVCFSAARPARILPGVLHSGRILRAFRNAERITDPHPRPHGKAFAFEPNEHIYPPVPCPRRKEGKTPRRSGQ